MDRPDGNGMKVVAVLVTQLDRRISAEPNPAGPGGCFAFTFRAVA
jgi:hypothetical protein